MSITQINPVPVEHRLREVPQSLRMIVQSDTWASNTPVGYLCHEAADEIELLRAAVRSAWESLRDCADDLAAELDARHSDRDRYPSIMRDWQRDMEPVARARELLGPGFRTE